MTPCTRREEEQFAKLCRWLGENGLIGITRKNDPLFIARKGKSNGKNVQHKTARTVDPPRED